jgi:L-arabinose isomerase
LAKEDLVFLGHDGPAHCAIGIGHIAGKIEKLAQLLDLEFHRVC